MAICELSAEFYKPSYVEYVYCLRCPITYDIFYVGKTQNLNNRLTQHINDGITDRVNKINQNKAAVIRGILSEDKKPIMSVIDKTEVRTQIDKFHASYKELFWISFYKEIGWNLTNIKDANADLENTDYKRYIRLIDRGGSISYDWYYFGVNDSGEKIYDLTRLKRDGYPIPIEYVPYQNKYNPYKNERFLKMLGDDIPPEYRVSNITYEKVYHDEDPNYYEQHDCFLFY